MGRRRTEAQAADESQLPMPCRRAQRDLEWGSAIPSPASRHVRKSALRPRTGCDASGREGGREGGKVEPSATLATESRSDVRVLPPCPCTRSVWRRRLVRVAMSPADCPHCTLKRASVGTFEGPRLFRVRDRQKHGDSPECGLQCEWSLEVHGGVAREIVDERRSRQPVSQPARDRARLGRGSSFIGP